MSPVSRHLSALALLITMMGSAACLRPSPSRHYYHLRTSPLGETNEKGTQILYIGPVDIDSFYDSYRIAYRESFFDINHYLYHLWYKKPSQMIRENLLDFFASSGLFGQTTDRMTSGDPHYILHCQTLHLEEIYEDDGSWGRLSMEWVLSDFRSGRELLRHRFDRKEVNQGRRIVDLVRSLSFILNSELKVFRDRIAAHFARETPQRADQISG